MGGLETTKHGPKRSEPLIVSNDQQPYTFCEQLYGAKGNNMEIELTDREVHLLAVAMNEMCKEEASDLDQQAREELANKIATFSVYMMQNKKRKAVLTIQSNRNID